MLNTRGQYPKNWPETASQVKDQANWCCVRCGHPHDTESGHILTVHHFDGNKSNCEWWNLMPLCQKCHLSVQARVDPEQPYFLNHSEWAKPYVAGFYAYKYLQLNLSREETMQRLEELLRYECAV